MRDYEKELEVHVRSLEDKLSECEKKIQDTSHTLGYFCDLFFEYLNACIMHAPHHYNEFSFNMVSTVLAEISARIIKRDNGFTLRPEDQIVDNEKDLGREIIKLYMGCSEEFRSKYGTEWLQNSIQWICKNWDCNELEWKYHF